MGTLNPHDDVLPPHVDPAAGERSPWWWVPSLYFAEAVPYVLVNSVSAPMFVKLGLSNADMATYTSLMYLPWVIKPLWAPLVDALGTNRRWVLVTEFLMCVAMFALVLALGTTGFLVWSLAALWAIALLSATHDVAADGFYMRAATKSQQAAFVGIRSTFYRLATVVAGGQLLVLIGSMEESRGIPAAWAGGLLAIAGLFLTVWVYHLIAMPTEVTRSERVTLAAVVGNFRESFATFLAKRNLLIGCLYLLIYRFAEGQVVKITQPFLLADPAKGGMGFTTQEVGFAYGTAGVLAMLAGGILGGVVIARFGLRRWILPMAFAMNATNLAFLLLAAYPQTGLPLATVGIVIEQFGYGFGFAGYMLYMIHFSQGPHSTAHFAFCTGIMALGMMVPGYISGNIQTWLGSYYYFYLWVLVATLPSFFVTWLASRTIAGDFGVEQK